MSDDLCTLALRDDDSGKYWFCFTCKGKWPCARVNGGSSEPTETH